MCSAAYQLSLFEDDLDVQAILREYNSQKRQRNLLRPTLLANFVRLEENDLVMSQLQWGLIPHWAKEKSIAYSTFNARSETLVEKPAFRDAYRKRRGVMVLDTYVEWREEEGVNVPYEFGTLDGRQMCFAGLWSAWEQNGSLLESCTMITCEPNSLAVQYQDRMPVILDQSDIDLWLYPSASETDLRALLTPFDPDRMFCKRANPEDFKRKAKATASSTRSLFD